ncbi:MAG: DUF2281 domain-containing protein [Elusimicrobia bacterium]|nr:DUF2281 domain-containing protein [Elusimicrobiota bacterium]
MAATKLYEKDLINIFERLPEDKANELLEFAHFLAFQYSKKPSSKVDKAALLLQQKALSKIWDNPEEDIYEL